MKKLKNLTNICLLCSSSAVCRKSKNKSNRAELLDTTVKATWFLFTQLDFRIVFGLNVWCTNWGLLLIYETLQRRKVCNNIDIQFPVATWYLKITQHIWLQLPVQPPIETYLDVILTDEYTYSPLPQNILENVTSLWQYIINIYPRKDCRSSLSWVTIFIGLRYLKRT